MAMDRMPWFKWWDGTCGDVKFRMVAEECKLPVSAVIAAWAYLLEHASRAAERGFIDDIDYDVMAYTLQLPDPETVCNAMKRRKMLQDDGYISKWEDRQGKREKGEVSGSSTERVRRYREKQKQNKNNDLDDETVENVDVTPVTDETEGNGMKRPKKKNREDKSKPKTLTPSSADADGTVTEIQPFNRFWDAYPRKVGKQDAHKAWTKIKPDPQLVDMMLAAIEKQKDGADWRRDDGQYIPHPATWLRGGRWLDDVRPYVAPPVKLPAGWWESGEGMKAAGLLLNPPLTPNKGEYPRDFAQRIRAALGQVDPRPGDEPDAPAAAPVPAPYIPPAPPADVQLTAEQQQARKEEFIEQQRAFQEAKAKLKQKSGVAQAGIQAANAA